MAQTKPKLQGKTRIQAINEDIILAAGCDVLLRAMVERANAAQA